MFSCTSELDEVSSMKIDNKVISGKDLGKNLIASFKDVNSRSFEIKTFSYPFYYGGAYLDKECLIINVTQTSPDVVEDLRIRCGGNGFILKKCNNAYAELLEVADKMDDFLLANNGKDKINDLKFYGFTICELSNDIEVRLGDVSKENIDRFKHEVSNVSYIHFVEETELPCFKSREYKLGESVFCYLEYGSIGFRAKQGTSTGFVTAGHVGKQVGLPIYEDEYSVDEIATVEATQFGGDLDAAFCKAINGNTFSNYVTNNFFEVNPKLASYMANTPIGFAGRHTSCTGYVTNPYASQTFKGGVTLSGIVEITTTSITQYGDSGGLIYTTDDMDIAGTLIGGYMNSSIAYFCPAARIVERYDLELY